MGRSETALALFQRGHNCAQTVCATFGPDLGLGEDDCLAIGAGFGAGAARQGEICGALSGALVVLGLRHGRGEPDAIRRKEHVYAPAQRLLARFRDAHGTLRCRAVGLDLGTAEGRAEADRREIYRTICAPLVREVVGLLEADAMPPT